MELSDDEKNLKRAIALSLSEIQSSSAPVIDLVDSEEEDEDVRKAIALSLQNIESASSSQSASGADVEPVVSHESGYAHPPLTNINPSTQPQSESDSSFPSKPTNALSGILGLDRKAMEQERLGRLGKRKRSVSPERPTKMIAKPTTSDSFTSEVNDSAGTKKEEVQYPRGTIKRTWAYKHPRTDDIKIEEVFQVSKPNIAVLSSFDWEDRWVFGKLRPEDTRQIWIMSAKGQELHEKMLREATEAGIPNFKPHFPPLDGNSQHMHSKLMLLFHENYLRIVVPTANMTRVNWGETNQNSQGESWQAAVLENSVFLIDLPRRLDGEINRKEHLPVFGKDLIDFLEAQETGNNVREGVLKFDFSGTCNLAFIHSIPGKTADNFPNRIGLPGLKSAVQRLGLDQVQHLELDYASSSLGALNESLLNQLYTAAGGHCPIGSSDFLDHVRIYFPTLDTVKESTGGPNCGGIITLNRAHYHAESFPKQCLRDYKSTRPGVLSHNKLLLARGRKKDGTPVAWAYIGSANLTESAWGSQKILKSGKLGKLNCRNWECGVLVPVPDDVLKELKLEDGEVPPMSVFKGTVEIPFQFPGKRYEGRTPWFFRDYM